MAERDSIRVTRNIVAQPALKAFQPVEYLPGENVRSDDETALAKAAGDVGTTIFHPVGTAKMGLPSDPMAVVDERLRVFGIERRVTIAFKVYDDRVAIIRVLYGGRNIDAILENDGEQD